MMGYAASLVAIALRMSAALLLQWLRQNRCERYGVERSTFIICDNESVRNRLLTALDCFGQKFTGT
jgi:hypothetical protein